MDFEHRQLVKNCCFCIDLKIAAVIIVFFHPIPWGIHTCLILERDGTRYYIALSGLCLYVVLLLVYLGAIFLEKSVLQIPLLVYFMVSMVLMKVMIAYSGTRKMSLFTYEVRIALEVTTAVILFCLDVYFYIVLYSFYVKMRKAELEARRAPH